MRPQAISDGIARAMLLSLGVAGLVVVEPIDMPAQLMRVLCYGMSALGSFSLVAWAILAVRHGVTTTEQ